MIFFIIFMIAIAVAILVTGAVQESKAVKFCALIPIAVMILGFFIFGINIIDSTEVGVVRTFGEIKYTLDSGLNIVNPITDTVSIYDLKVHSKEAAFMSYSKDAQPLTATIETQFAVQPDRIMEIAKEYGNYDGLEVKLANIIEEKAKVVFSRYSAMELLENRSTLSAEVEEEMTKIEEMFHITFTSVVIRDIDFSDAFEASVESKMEAEQNALKAEQEKKKAIIKAEEDREVAKINAEAEIAKAKGEADALMITKEALEKMPKNYTELQWISKWDGKLPTLVGEDSNLMVTPKID